MVLPNDLLIIMICKDTQLTNNSISLDQFSAHQNQIHCVQIYIVSFTIYITRHEFCNIIVLPKIVILIFL